MAPLEAGALAAGALGDGAGVWLAWAATDVPATAAAVSTATTMPERRAVPAPCLRSGVVFSGAVGSGAVFPGAVGCGAVCGCCGSVLRVSSGVLRGRILARAAALGLGLRAAGERVAAASPLVGVPARLPDLGLRTSSAPPAMISRPPSTMNGMAHGVEVSFGKVMVMELGAGLVPSAARRRDQSPSAGASQA